MHVKDLEIVAWDQVGSRFEKRVAPGASLIYVDRPVAMERVAEVQHILVLHGRARLLVEDSEVLISPGILVTAGPGEEIRIALGEQRSVMLLRLAAQPVDLTGGELDQPEGTQQPTTDAGNQAPSAVPLPGPGGMEPDERPQAAQPAEAGEEPPSLAGSAGLAADTQPAPAPGPVRSTWPRPEWSARGALWPCEPVRARLLPTRTPSPRPPRTT